MNNHHTILLHFGSYTIVMPICDICCGEYPLKKHNFEECCSLDVDWDITHLERLTCSANNLVNKTRYIKPNHKSKSKNTIQITQHTGLARNVIDKYYTKSSVVDKCIQCVKKSGLINKHDIIIEPSAGNGAFMQSLKLLSDHCRFFDIAPEAPGISTKDYLTFTIDEVKTQQSPTQTQQLPIHPPKIHVIGNPPFGRQSSMAIKFIKHSCKFADSISFILPCSFKKQSMRNRFAPFYHLINEIMLPKNSFLVNQTEFDVPCVFQVWVRKTVKRPKVVKLTPLNFEFVKRGDRPTISFRRVGVNAGVIRSTDIATASIQSHYFIRVDREKIGLLTDLQFDKNNTVGPRSISKQELIREFNKVLR
jgi:predicted RNA methylase